MKISGTPFKIWVVTKSPVDLEGTVEFVGAFTAAPNADAACVGAGTYTIAEMAVDRAYRGDLYDVRVKIVSAAAQYDWKPDPRFPRQPPK